jgi:hypothetical protein
MTRQKVDPDAEVEALHRKRVERAMRRNGLENAVPVHTTRTNGTIDVEGIADRESAIRNAIARDETPPETLAEVERDRQAAIATIGETRLQCDALRTAEKEVEEEVEAVVDRNPGHFTRKAEAASETAAEAIASALQATQAAAAAWREAAGAWSIVRTSHRRRGLEMPPEVPISDFGGAENELAKSQSRPFPGGGRQNWETFQARMKAQAA